ncbi:MAG: hypothetical protein L7F78_24020 [Syntrophales bacterium LBB04]|nr:hypothetical protein [Syntrophales bacterium LBB04]
MVNQTIAHFRQYLAARYATGHFAGCPADNRWSGKGGLTPDALWFEMWIWTRINRWLLRGNTNGYNASNHIPQWHLDANEIGMLDGSLSASYGTSVTGGGGRFWDIPVSDFCGNRFEFTDGLRLFNQAIYTAGKTVNPFTSPSDGYGHASFAATGLSLTGCTSGQSVTSYRAESALKLHGIPAGSTTAGQGGFDGQGIWVTTTGEIIALRGGACGVGVLCPGALSISSGPAASTWNSAARSVLVP